MSFKPGDRVVLVLPPEVEDAMHDVCAEFVRNLDAPGLCEEIPHHKLGTILGWDDIDEGVRSAVDNLKLLGGMKDTLYPVRMDGDGSVEFAPAAWLVLASSGEWGEESL